MGKKKRETENISNRVEALFQSQPNGVFNYKQVAARLNLNDASSRNIIIKRLNKLVEKKILIEIDRGKYQLNKKDSYITGVIDINQRGTGFVAHPDYHKDIIIPHKYLNKALPGDEVEVHLFKRFKGKSQEGRVAQIIKRKNTKFLGVIQRSENFAFVKAFDAAVYTDFFIKNNNILEAKDGQVVQVEWKDWPDSKDSPEAKVIRVLGEQGVHQTEMHSILMQYDLPNEFPVEVEKEAKSLVQPITEKEIKNRRDFRDILTLTIDPADAKDLDDALSFKVLENGNVEIGIHIADVTHYLREDTFLDDEAYQRGTSVYLVDRVVPMLPESLSNNLCSLNPNEDKLTYSAVFEIDNNAKIINRWFGRTVINCDLRFAYEEAQHIIETGSSTIPQAISFTKQERRLEDDVKNAVLGMDRLAKILRQNRMKNGAISFDKVEVKFHLDQENEPTGVYFKESKDANHLVEEFMLLANREVAEFIGKRKDKSGNSKTFVYRIHDEPNEEKLAGLENIANRFGYNIKFYDNINHSLNKLLKDVKGQKEQNLIDTLAVRSMSKAEYSTQNIGHYGLAFDYYSHFTSPIRRYPDVLVHRLLQRYLDNEKSADEETYEAMCDHCSYREYLATQAERDSIKYMQVKFMDKHREKVFNGVISGVTEWGIYVEIIENKCEGMVRPSDLNDDFYIFDKDEYAFIGKKSNNIYRLGDTVKVKVKAADLNKKQLDYYLLGHAEA